LVGAVLDPRGGSGIGIRSIKFDRPYIESVTYDFFRVGLAWTFANPQTRNADTNRTVIWVENSSGMWSGAEWTASRAPLVLSSSGSVRSSEFSMPAAKSAVVGSIENVIYRSLYDVYIGDSSVSETYDNNKLIRNNQPSFSAYVTAQANDVTGDGTAYSVINYTQDYESGGNVFGAASGIYTAPFSGRHMIFGNVHLGQLTSSHVSAELEIVTNSKTIHVEFNPYALSNSGEAMYSIQSICNMAAGDTAYLRVKVSGGTKVVDIKSPYTTLSGYFLG